MIEKLRLGVRLGVAFGAVLLLLLAVGGAAIWGMNLLAGLNQAIYRHPFTVSNAVLSIENDVLNIQHAIMHSAASGAGDPAFETVLDNIANWERETLAEFATIEKRYLGDMADVQRARQLYANWDEVRGRAMDLLRQGRRDLARGNAPAPGRGPDGNFNDRPWSICAPSPGTRRPISWTRPSIPASRRNLSCISS